MHELWRDETPTTECDENPTQGDVSVTGMREESNEWHVPNRKSARSLTYIALVVLATLCAIVLICVKQDKSKAGVTVVHNQGNTTWPANTQVQDWKKKYVTRQVVYGGARCRSRAGEASLWGLFKYYNGTHVGNGHKNSTITDVSECEPYNVSFSEYSMCEENGMSFHCNGGTANLSFFENGGEFGQSCVSYAYLVDYNFDINTTVEEVTALCSGRRRLEQRLGCQEDPVGACRARFVEHGGFDEFAIGAQINYIEHDLSFHFHIHNTPNVVDPNSNWDRDWVGCNALHSLGTTWNRPYWKKHEWTGVPLLVLDTFYASWAKGGVQLSSGVTESRWPAVVVAGKMDGYFIFQNAYTNPAGGGDGGCFWNTDGDNVEIQSENGTCGVAVFSHKWDHAEEDLWRTICDCDGQEAPFWEPGVEACTE